MNKVAEYRFYKTKYGEELLIDVVRLKDIKKFLSDEKRHSLTYYDITLITEGKGWFQIENKRYNVQEGDVLFTLPNVQREWDTQCILDGYALIFEEEFLLSFFNDPDFISRISYFSKTSDHPEKLTLSNEEYKDIQQLILRVQNEISAYKEKDKHILRAILYQILKSLDRIFIKENVNSLPDPQNMHIRKFVRQLNADYSRFHTVKYYAEKLCLTPNYLNELAKKETGVSAKQIINNKLFSESRKLLLYSSASITEITEILHFENPSYFVRFFRKHSGMTPLVYRNSKQSD